MKSNKANMCAGCDKEREEEYNEQFIRIGKKFYCHRCAEEILATS